MVRVRRGLRLHVVLIGRPRVRWDLVNVTLRVADGASNRVSVVRNAYEAILTSPSSLSFIVQRTGGQQRFVVPLPSAAGGKPYPYHAADKSKA